MPHRSYSVPPTTSLAQQASIDVPAPSLPVPLMLEIRDALPALEKAMAPELSAQCLPLCMRVLSSWILVSSNGSQCQEQEEKSGPPRSMTRSKWSRWFTQSFSRKKGVAPMTEKDISEGHQLINPNINYYDDDDDSSTEEEEEEEELENITDEDLDNEDNYEDSSESHHSDDEDDDDDDDDTIAWDHQQRDFYSNNNKNTVSTAVGDGKQHYAQQLSQSVTKRSISKFLNRLGVSVRNAIVGKQQYDKLAFPSPVAEEHNSYSSINDQYMWDDETIWVPRDPINQDNEHSPMSATISLELANEVLAANPTVAAAEKRNAAKALEKHQQQRQQQQQQSQQIEGNTREKKPTVRASKTDMDVSREESVPFIKMGIGRQQRRPVSMDVEDAQQYRLSSTSFDLRWQERFHEQQHDKIDTTMKNVSIAFYEIIAHNHAFGLFDYDDAFTGSPLLEPDSDTDAMQELFMPEPVTTWEDIYEQMAYVVECGELTSEHAIISYIYVVRMLETSDQSLCDANWRLVLLAAMLLAVKVWDDCAVYNYDFCQIFPELDIRVINMIERRFMMAMNWDVSCTCSFFAKTYFDLRELASTRITPA